MARNILCVAEKPSVAKQVAEHLGGGAHRTEPVRGNPFVKNIHFDFDFGQPWGRCNVTMTSVLGHLNRMDFTDRHRTWGSCEPVALFEAPVVTAVAEDKKAIAENIKRQARHARSLFIWTDCDREGENIGGEIRAAARATNARIEVKRAQFSNYELEHIVRAAQRPVNLDDRQVDAVNARQEIDLRLGAAFTRFTTRLLQSYLPANPNADGRGPVLSYGSCQFPTLGFVVDRYFKVKNFEPEKFWKIEVTHQRNGIAVHFHWNRTRLFDRAATVVLFEKCIKARLAKVVKVQKRATSHWRPLPLTTVELQKIGSSQLRMSSAMVMRLAEDLYRDGWISYPRTETDQFDSGFDLKRYIQRQVQDPTWGQYAQRLLDGEFRQPRCGRHNDKAHPPIHPVLYKNPASLEGNERRVYEFVVRRYLACCSDDAKGESTCVELQYGPELFDTTGLVVTAQNFLEVYPYDRWTSSQTLPAFTLHETFEPSEAMIKDGKTSAPGYLTEPELIGLMEANGIGTDATMADHIQKIQARDYVRAIGGSGTSTATRNTATSGRGRGRGRGGAHNNSSTTSRNSNNSTTSSGGSIQQFIPTTLGVALIEGYDSIGLETSLSKPFLRREMEEQMRAICAGTADPQQTVREVLRQYRAVFERAKSEERTLRQTAMKYLMPPATAAGNGVNGRSSSVVTNGRST